MNKFICVASSYLRTCISNYCISQRLRHTMDGKRNGDMLGNDFMRPLAMIPNAILLLHSTTSSVVLGLRVISYV